MGHSQRVRVFSGESSYFLALFFFFTISCGTFVSKLPQFGDNVIRDDDIISSCHMRTVSLISTRWNGI